MLNMSRGFHSNNGPVSLVLSTHHLLWVKVRSILVVYRPLSSFSATEHLKTDSHFPVDWFANGTRVISICSSIIIIIVPIEGMTNSCHWNKAAIKVNIKEIFAGDKRRRRCFDRKEGARQVDLMDDYDDSHQNEMANITITTVLHYLLQRCWWVFVILCV